MKIYNFFTKEYSTVEELFNAFFIETSESIEVLKNGK